MKLKLREYRYLLVLSFCLFITNNAIAQKDFNNSIKFSYSYFAFAGLSYYYTEPVSDE